MKRGKGTRNAVAVLGLLALVACGTSESGDGERRHAAEALADQEDPVCGMFVREQPAPRAQLVHRDGSRFFLCSLADLLVHLDAPSPHGKVEAVFVEVLALEEDPQRAASAEHPWLHAEEAVYVVGVDRSGIMGEPVLAYANRGDADLALERYHGERILDYAGLRAWWEAIQAAR